MDEPLLPCPFCGAAARAVDDNSYGDCQVFCAECDVSPDGGMEVMVMLPKERFEDAKRIWNRRAVLSPTARTEIERLAANAREWAEAQRLLETRFPAQHVDGNGRSPADFIAGIARALDTVLGSASTKEDT